MKRKCCILEKDVKKDDIDNKHNNEDILMKNKFGFTGHIRMTNIFRRPSKTSIFYVKIFAITSND